jgi:sarcosine oxidase
MTQTFDTIVAGVGGMGSAALYHLAKRGQRVLGLERFEIGHTQGSSHGETRIIRMAYFEGSNYVPIVQRAYQLWDELSAEAGTDLIRRTGSLEMSEAGFDFVDRSLASCLDHGLPYELLDAAETMQRFPAFRLHPETSAIFQPDGGYVLCEAALRAHVDLARHHGAQLRTGETVLEFKPTPHGGVEVRTNRATYTAGSLILTAGAWMQQLVPALAGTVTTSKQAIAWFAPRTEALFRPGNMPVFIHFGAEGEFYGFPQHSAQGVKVGGPHFARVPIDPDQPDRTPEPHQIDALRGFMARHLPDAAGPPIAASGCIYTSTPDEHFVIDRLPGTPQVVVMSPCSGHGYKFASAMGDIAADLAIKGHTWADIAPFALSRFTGH